MAQNNDRLNRLLNRAVSLLISRGYNLQQNYPDPNGGHYTVAIGKKYTHVGHATSRQLEQIDTTAQSDQEVLDRITSLLLDGVDPGEPPETRMVSMAEVESIVREKVSAALAAALAGGVPVKALAATAPAPAAVQAIKQSEEKEKSQQKSRKPRKPGKENLRETRMDVWRDRCAAMGVPVPSASAFSQEHVHGKSLAGLEKKWEEHQAKAWSGFDKAPA